MQLARERMLIVEQHIEVLSKLPLSIQPTAFKFISKLVAVCFFILIGKIVRKLRLQWLFPLL